MINLWHQFGHTTFHFIDPIKVCPYISIDLKLDLKLDLELKLGLGGISRTFLRAKLELDETTGLT